MTLGEALEQYAEQHEGLHPMVRAVRLEGRDGALVGVTYCRAGAWYVEAFGTHLVLPLTDDRGEALPGLQVEILPHQGRSPATL